VGQGINATEEVNMAIIFKTIEAATDRAIILSKPGNTFSVYHSGDDYVLTAGVDQSGMKPALAFRARDGS